MQENLFSGPYSTGVAYSVPPPPDSLAGEKGSFSPRVLGLTSNRLECRPSSLTWRVRVRVRVKVRIRGRQAHSQKCGLGV